MSMFREYAKYDTSSKKQTKKENSHKNTVNLGSPRSGNTLWERTHNHTSSTKNVGGKGKVE